MTITFSGKRDQILAQGKRYTEPVVVKDCVNCQLIDCDFDCSKLKEGDKALNATNNKNCTFKKLKFHDRKTGGVIFNFTGARPKDCIIEDCEFYNFTSQAANGAEPLRLGNSQFSHNFYDTTVRNCNFHDIRTKEPECISIKSCGNLIENNKFSNNSCSVVVRHGHTNEIRNNQFNGEGGIRVYGKNNKIENNVHRNNKSSKFPPLSLVNGNTAKDPGDEKGVEQGKEQKDGHATYTQVINNHVLNNTYEECCKPVIWGRDSRKFRPSGVKFMQNKFINHNVSATAIEFSGGAKAEGNVFEDNVYYGSKLKIPESVKNGFKKGSEQQPDPVVVPDPEPEPEVPPQEPEVPAEQEEQEQPVEEDHVPDNLPEAKMCAIHGHAEAKVLQQVYVCGEHADYFRPKLKQLLEETKADAVAQEIIKRDMEDSPSE